MSYLELSRKEKILLWLSLAGFILSVSSFFFGDSSAFLTSNLIGIALCPYFATGDWFLQMDVGACLGSGGWALFAITGFIAFISLVRKALGRK